jgi:hypothetical protein
LSFKMHRCLRLTSHPSHKRPSNWPGHQYRSKMPREI